MKALDKLNITREEFIEQLTKKLQTHDIENEIANGDIHGAYYNCEALAKGDFTFSLYELMDDDGTFVQATICVNAGDRSYHIIIDKDVDTNWTTPEELATVLVELQEEAEKCIENINKGVSL